MIFHKFDTITNLYLESVESDDQPENSISGNLPEMDDKYTLALIDGELVSVIRPEPIPTADQISAARQAKANANLNSVRALRQPLLDDADRAINKAEDPVDAPKANDLRTYRMALRDCTDSLKKVNGDAKLSCENLVPEQFVFPTKPE